MIVSLLWDRDTGELSVAVVDARGGAFELVLGSDECALDVFYHPYAYAAFRTRRALTKELGQAMSRESAAQDRPRRRDDQGYTSLNHAKGAR